MKQIILILVAFILGLLVQKSCNRNGVTVKTETVIKTDTVLTVKRDTVWQKEIVQLPTNKTAQKPDTVYLADSSTQLVYTETSEDSAIIIGFSAYAKNALDSIRIWYLLKQPRIINNTFTKEVITERTITNTVYKSGFYVGGGASYSGDKSLDFNGSVLHTTKKGVAFQYSYGVLQKTHAVTMFYRLTPK